MSRRRNNYTGAVAAIMAGIFALIAAITALICLERIPAGYVGVVYSMNGGVQDELLMQGFHFVNPTKTVKEFSVGNEQLILTKDKREGSPDDDSFMISTADNANISVSFQMSYRFIQDKVVDTYKQFRGMSGEDIVNQRVRTVLKAKISEVTTFYTMMDIYSGDRGKINNEITEFLRTELEAAYGIYVIDAYIIDVHPDAQLQQTIDDRVKAMQKKQQAEAEQETIRVQNETKILEAEAEARVQEIAAESAAKIKQIESEAEAAANERIAKSLTEEYLRFLEMQARIKHGWVTVQGASSVVTTN